MYHYAANNPIRYTDPDGRIPYCVVTAIVGAALGAAIGIHNSWIRTGKVDWEEVGRDALIGAAIGLFAGALTAEAVTSTPLIAGSYTASYNTVMGGTATAGVNTATVGAAASVQEIASSAKLTQNMLAATGGTKPFQTAAHHIVAGASKFAEPARKVLAKFGISINDAANGVFLPQNTESANPTGAMVHSTLHTIKYYDMVNEMLMKCTSKGEVLETLKSIGEKLSSGSW